MPLNGLGNRDGLHARLMLQRVIKPAQKFTAGLRIVFPGVFAIQNDGHDRVLPAIQNRLGRLFNVLS